MPEVNKQDCIDFLEKEIQWIETNYKHQKYAEKRKKIYLKLKSLLLDIKEHENHSN